MWALRHRTTKLCDPPYAPPYSGNLQSAKRSPTLATHTDDVNHKAAVHANRQLFWRPLQCIPPCFYEAPKRPVASAARLLIAPQRILNIGDSYCAAPSPETFLTIRRAVPLARSVEQ